MSIEKLKFFKKFFGDFQKKKTASMGLSDGLSQGQSHGRKYFAGLVDNHGDLVYHNLS